MIVADASALASQGRAGVLGLACDAFEVHATRSSVDVLSAMSAFHGPRGDGARAALDRRDRLVVHERPSAGIETSRVDAAQGDCAALAVELDAEVLVTDDLLAVPELARLVPRAVVPSPVVLSALVRRGALAPADARFRLDELVVRPRWLAGPLRRRAAQSLGAAAG